MAIYKRDIASINLETGTIHRTFLNHSIGLKDQKADHFGIRVFRNGEPVDLTGVSVQGIFMPPQGDPIAITSGNIVSGNEAEVVLPQACYNYDGQFCLAIKLVDSNNSVTGTMRIVDGMVDNTHASGTVAPTSAVPTYQEILSTYDAMVAATAAANGAIAATYSSSSTYKVGDYCIHDGGLYRCTTAITTAEAWTSGHWTAAKIGPDVSDLKSALYTVDENTNAILFRIKGFASNPRPCIINASTNKYIDTAGTYHIMIPIDSGDEIKIKGQATYTGRIGFLKNLDVPKAGDTPSYSSATGFTELLGVTVNTSYTYTAPSDARYLYVAHTSSGHSLLPKVLTVNGIDMYKSFYQTNNDLLAYSDELNGRIGLWVIQKGSYQLNSWDGQTGFCAFLKVNPGSRYTIKSAASAAQYRGLKTLTLPVKIGDTADISEAEGWTEQRSVASNKTESGTIPDDVNYLCFYIGVNSTYPKMPVILSIDGADYRKSIMENIGDNSGITGKLNNELNKDLREKAIYKGRNNEGVWDNTSGYTAIIEVNPGDSYCIEADLDVNCPYFGVKTIELPPQNGNTTDFSDAEGWDDVRYVGLSGTPKVVTGTVPSDVHYLCFYAGTNTSYTRLPKAITINNINVMWSLVENIRGTRAWANDTLDFNETVYNDEEIWTSGHGGYTATYPLNSLMAIRDAAQHGFRGIETDVQFTSDNVPVLCHDDGLYTYARNPDGSRVGTSKEDTVFIHEITYEQLLYYDFGLAKGLPAGMKITTFEQMVQTTKRLGLRVLIELKRYLTPTNAQIDILFDILDKYRMRKNVIFHSAVLSALQYVHGKDPMMPVSYIVGDSITQNKVNEIRSLKDRNKAYINGNCSISSDEIARIKEAGLLYIAGLPETESDILNATPISSIFVSNDLIAEDVMRDYELGQLPD